MKALCIRTVLITACLAAAGCGDEKRLPTEPTTEPPADATFTRVQAEVFTPKCALSGCHMGPASAAQEGMVLAEGSAYDNIVMVRSNQNPNLFRIAPGDPANSYLVRKITPFTDIIGDHMPQTGSISDGQRQLVTQWVVRGAPRD
ncbi:MAG TPA: hypothetical protein VGK86_06455 [Thermoanaerobaculia bacterium]